MSTEPPTDMGFACAGVSTSQPDEALQRDALEAAGADRVYAEHASGATDSRPSLAEMLGHLRPGGQPEPG
jgi:DNA invertase Pin-like site-specific DNA recombinase